MGALRYGAHNQCHTIGIRHEIGLLSVSKRRYMGAKWRIFARPLCTNYGAVSDRFIEYLPFVYIRFLKITQKYLSGEH